MKKRLLSTLLALCMALALLPGTGWAVDASGTCGENLTWSLSDGMLTIRGTGPMTNYEKVGDTSATHYNNPWDSQRNRITSVVIGSGVTSIGNCAFVLCERLTSVSIPNSVTTIGESAFASCTRLAGVDIPDSVTAIGKAAFGICLALTDVTIPGSVTTIGENAFVRCSNLSSVAIPDSVITIGDQAFMSCSSLTSVDIPDSVTTIGVRAFGGCSNLTSVVISGSVTTTGELAFQNCSGLVSVTIPDGVTSIGQGTFYDCASLTSVDIPDSVTSIKDSAFYGCDSLTDVYYGGSEGQWEQIDIGYRNAPLLNATIHYSSAEPDNGGNITSEHIYDTPGPGEDTYLDVERLNKVTDPATAAEAVRDMVDGMTQEQKVSPTGIDLATLYAETAVAKAASKPVTGTDILINAAAVADLKAEAAQAVTAVETALVNGGITTARYLSNTVTLTTNSTSEITIRLDPDILTTSVDKIRVEGPSYALTFKIADWTDALTEVLTFKAAPVNPGTRAAVSSVDINLPGGSSSNPVTVSLPTDTGTDTTYQAVVSSTGGATASKYNPATTDIDGKVNTSGTYTVETKEVDFTDIANKSAEMQKAIKYLAARDILGGTGNNKFSPDASISRAELAKLVVMALGKLDNGAASKFSDVTKSDWFYSVVASSQKLGYIGGYEDNTFRGKSVISKNEIVVIAGRVLGTEMKYKTPDNAAAYLNKYSDTVAAWAQPQVALATRENLIVYRTDGTFSGAKDMTRGDAAIILYRLFQRLW